jgi:hypothetical protein
MRHVEFSEESNQRPNPPAPIAWAASKRGDCANEAVFWITKSAPTAAIHFDREEKGERKHLMKMKSVGPIGRAQFCEATVPGSFGQLAVLFSL